MLVQLIFTDTSLLASLNIHDCRSRMWFPCIFQGNFHLFSFQAVKLLDCLHLYSDRVSQTQMMSQQPLYQSNGEFKNKSSFFIQERFILTQEL